MNLVIVESPAKAKTIEGFLGKDFTVKSSYGHVRDLAKSGLGVDVENGFIPSYQVMPDKKAILKELKILCDKSDIVWLATDEDREGEAISWHLLEALELDEAKTRRIVFHEITKSAILKAIEHPRTIDRNLVDAQQARRVLDRLVGFELSPVLWRKVKPSLSAGRVQSVAVRVIVEREREVIGFKVESFFKVQANFKTEKGENVKADLSARLTESKEASDLLNTCIGADYSIKSIETKPAKKSPSAPFTTSTLQQEASRKLSFSVGQTMSVAQRLYEAGKITYMRTDSVNLSKTAIDAAKDEILRSFGEEYANPRKYSTKSKSAQEAHEAIRPTDMGTHALDGDSQESRLYELIWKRTLASQMAEAKLEKTTAKISISTSEREFVAQGEVLKFDGFLKVYMETTEDDETNETAKGMLPQMAQGQDLTLASADATQRFTHHPARYTEASLVKKLEELGIGRPSTYAPTISTIQKRGYVEKTEKEGKERNYTVYRLENEEVKETIQTEVTGREKNKLFPTDIGMVVNDFLVVHFDDILNFHFTADVEKEFDEIANGQKKWNEMIDQFYGPFHKNIEHTLETGEKATGARLLGIDPKSGKNVYAKIGRYGPMIQIGEVEDEEKPKFASVKGDLSMTTIELDEALDLFKLPRELGEYKDIMVVIGVGRYGPYARYDGKFYSLGDEHNPLTITLEVATELIEIKMEEDRKKLIRTYEEDSEVKVLNGRWGPYISYHGKNYKIPKDKVAEELTLADCEAISKIPKAPRRGKKK